MTPPAPGARRPRGSRRAVGGVPAASSPPSARGTDAAGEDRHESEPRSGRPAPETLDEVADDAERDRWLASQRPPHWG